MSKPMVQANERIDLDVLKDAIREVVREELDQLTIKRSGAPIFVRQANSAAHRVKTPSGAEALAGIDSPRSIPEGAWPASSSRSLGQWIVVDPAICRGKPTFRNTRVMVWQVLELVAQGMAWVSIEEQWEGKINREMIAEAVQLANRSADRNAPDLLRRWAQWHAG